MFHHCFWDFLNLFVCSLLRKEWFLPVGIYFCGECWRSYPHFACHFQARRLIWFPTMSHFLRLVFTCVAAKQYIEVQEWIKKEGYQTKVIGFSLVKSVNVQLIGVKGNTGGLHILIPSFSHGHEEKKCLCLWIIPKEACLQACKGGISIPNGKLANTED